MAVRKKKTTSRMGRPRGTKKGVKAISLTIAKETLKEIDSFKLQNNITRSVAITKLCDYALKNIDNIEV